MLKLKNIILSILASFAVTIPLISLKYLDIKLFANTSNILLLNIIFFISLYINREDYNLSKGKLFLSILFSFFMIIGESYIYNGTILNTSMILFLIKLLGYNYLFRSLFHAFDILLSKFKIKDRKINNKYILWYKDKIEKYPFRTSLITILIFWSIYVIAFYPIILNPDSSFQIMQFFNVKTKYVEYVIQRNPNVNMTNHHPILQTFMLGFSILIGRKLGSDNFGLFIYSFFQIIFLSSVLSLTVKEVKKSKIRLILILIYSLVPIFPLYAMTAVKDTYYSGFMVLFVLYIYRFVRDYKDKKLSIKNLVILLLITLFLSLFRNNGVYIVILTIPFMIIFSKENRLRLSCMLLVFLVLITSYNKILIPKLGISDGSIREALSIPFQQTARLSKYDSKVISKKDKKIIDMVLNYDTLADRYNPELADNVKNEYNKYTTNDELNDYFKVWFKYLKKRPLIYIDATLNNTYGYIYPNTHSNYLYTNYDSRIVYGYNKNYKKNYVRNSKYRGVIKYNREKHNYKKYITNYDLKFKKPLVNYHFNKLYGLRNVLTIYGNMFPYIPIIGLICSIGFSTWMLLILSVYIKKRKYKLMLIPLYLSLLVCFASPANTYFRYALPIIFSLPFIISIMIDKN